MTSKTDSWLDAMLLQLKSVSGAQGAAFGPENTVTRFPWLFLLSEAQEATQPGYGVHDETELAHILIVGKGGRDANVDDVLAIQEQLIDYFDSGTPLAALQAAGVVDVEYTNKTTPIYEGPGKNIYGEVTLRVVVRYT